MKDELNNYSEWNEIAKNTEDEKLDIKKVKKISKTNIIKNHVGRPVNPAGIKRFFKPLNIIIVLLITISISCFALYFLDVDKPTMKQTNIDERKYNDNTKKVVVSELPDDFKEIETERIFINITKEDKNTSNERLIKEREYKKVYEKALPELKEGERYVQIKPAV